MAKRGRKGKWETNVQPRLRMIENWCRDGLIEEVICKKLDVHVSTFNEYKKKYSELKEALKNGKEEIDYKVESCLLKRALGYQFTEKHYEVDANGTTKEKEIIKEVAPDVTAQIFWLKNRKKEQWRDKQHIEHEGQMGVEFSHKNLTDEELIELAKKQGIDIDQYIGKDNED